MLKRVLTFFYDAALVVQHPLHLAAPDVHQATLPQEGLPPIKASAVGERGTNGDQKAYVMLS